MRSLKWAAAIALLPTLACAQSPLDVVASFGFVPPLAIPSSLGPPAPGMPVNFVACPERTAGGAWIARDPVSGYLYSLAGAPVPPNLVIQVSGVISAELPSVPGWGLTPIRVLAGGQPCQSAGVLQHVPGSYGVGPFFGAPPIAPVNARY